MHLLIQRQPPEPGGTLGEMSVDGARCCATLEPSPGDPAHPCIPAGVYPVAIAWSEKFRREMPRVENVPGRTAIEIHWGNFASDTEGCILVGATAHAYPRPTIWDSRETFEALFPRIQQGIADGGVTLDVREAASPPSV